MMLAMTLSAVAAGHRFTLVIDAGHGGHDAGALGSFSKEKNINLNQYNKVIIIIIIQTLNID